MMNYMKINYDKACNVALTVERAEKSEEGALPLIFEGLCTDETIRDEFHSYYGVYDKKEKAIAICYSCKAANELISFLNLLFHEEFFYGELGYLYPKLMGDDDYSRDLRIHDYSLEYKLDLGLDDEDDIPEEKLLSFKKYIKEREEEERNWSNN